MYICETSIFLKYKYFSSFEAGKIHISEFFLLKQQSGFASLVNNIYAAKVPTTCSFDHAAHAGGSTTKPIYVDSCT